MGTAFSLKFFWALLAGVNAGLYVGQHQHHPASLGIAVFAGLFSINLPEKL